MKRVRLITLPGIGGSGENHWQTLWERADSSMTRFAPPDWNKPSLSEWCDALERAVDSGENPVILVAHSLACLLVAHWAAQSATQIAGAFLVAVPDPNSPVFPSAAISFRSVPAGALRFPSLIVESSDDPYGSPEYVQVCAAQWGSQIINIGAFGHINALSNLGSWEQGRTLLDEFAKTALSGE